MQSQTQGLRTQLKADPRMILANSILHMSCMELQASIEQEILENPLLERAEEEYCERCGEIVGRCRCATSIKDIRALEDAPSPNYEPIAESYQGEWLDPLTLVEERTNLADHVLWQARVAADPALHPIIEYLVCSLKPSGYLGVPIEEAAVSLGVPLARIEEALKVIQGLDPAGVGARDLQECLLLQVTAAEADGSVPACVRPILTDCWKALSANKVDVIARQLKLSRAVTDEGVHWIRTTLSPYPGERFRTPWEHDLHRSTASVRPDVIIQLVDDGGFTVSVVDHERTQLHLNPTYTRLWRQMQKSPRSFPEAERKMLSEYWIRAQMFLRSLGQRRELLLRVTECLLEEQEEFFRSQNSHTLQPLTQTKLASILRVHESTISRTVADKFMQLPDGDVMPFSYFFGRATNVKQEVAALIAEENPRVPLSDQKISDILNERGFCVARRTVMKYREELNILSTRQRARC
ncbi:MAG TPA: RNA polymerase factor sigma-54 [Armatimonadota bacterium]|jgi:RNA polymerase sigma-54 factor